MKFPEIEKITNVECLNCPNWSAPGIANAASFGKKAIELYVIIIELKKKTEKIITRAEGG